MAETRRRDLRARLTALAGLVVIVGGAALVLFLAGVLGGQGGGETESGVKIGDAQVLAPPPAPGRGELAVEPKVGALAPDFEISDYNGVRHRLSSFRGRPVYLNFWASWCVPCQAELPDIQELLDRHEDELIVVTVNRREPLERARLYFQNIEKLNGEPGLSFSVNGLDPDDTLYGEYRGLGMPVSVFIDADGVVTRVNNGLIRLPQMEEAVAEAIASAAPSGGSAPGGSIGY
ncbi:MAG: TlpA disulfide reductase family protein [Dehalococcoidia bacterium]|nr:TlpA disulfide reductase family protein [Dehalococcoidia bacterium]